MRRMLPALRDWREANHRWIVEQEDDRFLLALVSVLALVPALLALLVIADGPATLSVALVSAMGALAGFMLGIVAIRAKGRRDRR